MTFLLERFAPAFGGWVPVRYATASDGWTTLGPFASKADARAMAASLQLTAWRVRPT